jgi:hypothetical protein
MYNSYNKCQINPVTISVMEEDNEIALAILNEIIYSSTRFTRIFVSQGYLAAKFKVSPRWVNKLLARWKESGVLDFHQRGFNRSCLYYIHPAIYLDKNRLKYKLSAAALLFSVSALCSAIPGKEFLLSNNKNIYIQKTATTYRFVSIPDEDTPYWHLRRTASKNNQTFILINDHASSFQQDVPIPEETGEFQKKKEFVMTRPIIQLIQETFRTSDISLQILKTYSDEALQQGILKYNSHPDKKSIRDPLRYISTIAKNYSHPASGRSSFPKTGKLNGYQKKIVHGSTNANHSPSKQPLKTSKNERITFVLREIANYEKHLAERRESLSKMASGDGLIKIAENAIANYKRELADLHYSPDDAQCDMPRYKQDDQEASEYGIGNRDVDEALDKISADKSDPEGYKLMMRKYLYHRTAGQC